MFDPESRYAEVPAATHVLPDGREVAYLRRRFLPQGREMPLLTEVTVTAGDRLDLITAGTLGEATWFWRVADKNDAMDPSELVATPGRKVAVPVPQP